MHAHSGQWKGFANKLAISGIIVTVDSLSLVATSIDDQETKNDLLA